MNEEKKIQPTIKHDNPMQKITITDENIKKVKFLTCFSLWIFDVWAFINGFNVSAVIF